MTTFHNFGLIIETSSAETVDNPILENRNIYVLFVHSLVKKILKKYDVKKE